MKDINRKIVYLFYNSYFLSTALQLKLREWNGATLIRESMLLKKTNPELKISAGVGGWNFGTEAFTAVCKDESTMQVSKGVSWG